MFFLSVLTSISSLQNTQARIHRKQEPCLRSPQGNHCGVAPHIPRSLVSLPSFLHFWESSGRWLRILSRNFLSKFLPPGLIFIQNKVIKQLVYITRIQLINSWCSFMALQIWLLPSFPNPSFTKVSCPRHPPHCSCLDNPRDGLPSMGSHRVRHNWSYLAATAAAAAL